MNEWKPPAWDHHPLSKFFADAEFNTRVTALSLAPIYKLLQSTHELFCRFEEAIENDGHEELLVPRFLIVRAHASALAGLRLAMSGQTIEAFPVLRSAVELAWYALHIAKDPSSPERVTIWLNRNESDTAKARCKSEFTIGNVRRTHEGLDANTAGTLLQLYEQLIDFGAHPNQFGVMAAMTKSESAKQVNFSVGILSPQPLATAFALRMAVGVAIGALKAFQLIFPARFTLLGIDQGIDRLVVEANRVLTSYAPGEKA